MRLCLTILTSLTVVAAVALPGTALAGELDEPTLRALLTGKLAVEEHPHLVRHGSGWLDREAASKLDAMLACARDPACSGVPAGTPLHVCSRYRSFQAQRFQWFRNLRRYGDRGSPTDVAQRALKFLALPGSSRHHWGTDIDINFSKGKCRLSNHHFRSAERSQARCARLKERCETAARAACTAQGDSECRRPLRRCDRHLKQCPRFSGRAAELYDWMVEHADEYGFCQPYRGFADERQPGLTEGYAEENWHWSYCCKAQDYTAAFEKRLAALAPSLDDLFGNGAGFGKSGERRKEAYETFLLPAYRERVVNVHPSCQRCAEKCKK